MQQSSKQQFRQAAFTRAISQQTKCVQYYFLPCAVLQLIRTLLALRYAKGPIISKSPSLLGLLVCPVASNSSQQLTGCRRRLPADRCCSAMQLNVFQESQVSYISANGLLAAGFVMIASVWVAPNMESQCVIHLSNASAKANLTRLMRWCSVCGNMAVRHKRAWN